MCTPLGYASLIKGYISNFQTFLLSVLDDDLSFASYNFDIMCIILLYIDLS